MTMTSPSSTTPASPEVEAAVLSLVAATRELMLAVGTSDLDADALQAAEASIRQLTTDLGERTRPRLMRMPFDSLAKARESGSTGTWSMTAHNPMGFPIPVSFDGDRATATVVANALHEGPHESLHGGYAAHLMDCMLGGLVQSTGMRAVTASLDVQYVRRTPLDVPLDLHANLVSIDGRKLVVEGHIEHDGQPTVTARGLFITIGQPES